MPVKTDMMKTIVTIQICDATPMPALPWKPTKWPTITWSMMPCTPPIMFVSIVGQASFQTVGTSGPSMIERSYFRRCCVARPGRGGSSVVEVAADPLGVGGAIVRAGSVDGGSSHDVESTAEREHDRRRARLNGRSKGEARMFAWIAPRIWSS